MQNRRKFFSTLIRGGIFASLSLFSGVMIRRWSEVGDCRQNFACGNCTLASGCQLPEADKYRLGKAIYGKTKANDGRARE